MHELVDFNEVNFFFYMLFYLKQEKNSQKIHQPKLRHIGVEIGFVPNLEHHEMKHPVDSDFYCV